MNTTDVWERKSSSYDAYDQGCMPERIVSRLLESGILEHDSDVLEIGSGPGTYSRYIAPRCRTLHCLDSSKVMLERLSASCGTDNIIPVHCNWPEYSPDRTFDLCIATLCPGSGSPRSIERMESLSSGHNALVFWRHNHGDDPVSETRRLLGIDDPLLERGKGRTRRWLEENGRNIQVDTFEDTIHYEVPVEDMIARIVNDIGQMDDMRLVEDAAMESIEPFITEGRFVMDAVNQLDLIIW